MRKTIIAVAMLLLSSVSLMAQSTPPSEPTVSLINISGSASGFGGQQGTQPASIVAAGLQLTKTVSVAYEQINVSSGGADPRFKLGLVNYSNTLDKYLGKKLSSKFTFDSSNLVLTVGVGGGRCNFAGRNSIAETAHISLTRPLASHIGWQIISYQYVHGAQSGLINKSYNSAATGPIFYF